MSLIHDRPDIRGKRLARGAATLGAVVLASAATLLAREASPVYGAGLTAVSRVDSGVQDCSNLMGVQVPPSVNGPVDGTLSLQVMRFYRQVASVEDRTIVRDVTEDLKAGASFNLLNRDGTQTTINSAPAQSVDYALVASNQGNPEALSVAQPQYPFVRAEFGTNDVDSPANPKARVELPNGGHEFRTVGDKVEIHADKADGIKEIATQCGSTTWRRFKNFTPWQIIAGGRLVSPGTPINVADHCDTTDTINHRLDLIVPVEQSKPAQPNILPTPVPVVPPAQIPGERPIPAPVQLPK